MGRAEQKAKDSAMAARLKAQGVTRKDSTATLPALESRLKRAEGPRKGK